MNTFGGFGQVRLPMELIISSIRGLQLENEKKILSFI